MHKLKIRLTVLFKFLFFLPGIFLHELAHATGAGLLLARIERFVVLKGKGKISLRRKYQDEIVEYMVDGAFPSYVDIPTLHTHNIENVGDSEMIVLFWSHQLYDSSNPDTYVEEV